MQKYVHFVDLEKWRRMSIWLQNLASIQRRTSPDKFGLPACCKPLPGSNKQRCGPVHVEGDHEAQERQAHDDGAPEREVGVLEDEHGAVDKVAADVHELKVKALVLQPGEGLPELSLRG